MATQYGFAPKTPEEEFESNWLFDTFEDAYSNKFFYNVIGFSDEAS